MTQSSPLRPRDRSLHPGFIWAGLALYGAANFGMYAAGAIGEPLGAALFPAAVAAVAALTYWALRWRGAAIGLAAGYLLVAIVSGGACVGLGDLDEVGPVLSGVAIYVAALIALGIGIAVAEIVRQVRRRR